MNAPLVSQCVCVCVCVCVCEGMELAQARDGHS